jgi:hypothetical protein
MASYFHSRDDGLSIGERNQSSRRDRPNPLEEDTVSRAALAVPSFYLYGTATLCIGLLSLEDLTFFAASWKFS